MSLPASVPAIAPIQEAPLVVPAPIAQPQVEETIQITMEKDTAPEITPEQHLVNKFIGYAPPSETNFGALIKPNKVAKQPDLAYRTLSMIKAQPKPINESWMLLSP